jgi:hypothetical protein
MEIAPAECPCNVIEFGSPPKAKKNREINI